MRSNTTPQIDGSDATWSELETLVEDTAKLTRTSISTREFHNELVKRLVHATGARSVVIWCHDANGRFSVEARIDMCSAVDVDARLLAIRSQNVGEIARSGRPAFLLPHQSDMGIQNPTSDVLLLQPAIVNEQIVAVVETFHDQGTSTIEDLNRREVVAVFADLIAEFSRNCQLREFQSRAAASLEREQFVDQVHRSLELKRAAFAIANEAVRVTGCDRVLVLNHRDAGCPMLSISGLDTVDRRSTRVRAAELLAKAVATAGDTLWHSGELRPFAAPLDRHLQSYLDSSPVRSLAVVPLGESGSDTRRGTAGVVLFERFENSPWTDSQKRSIEFVCRHSATALRNANEHVGLPLLGANRFLQRWLKLFGLRRLPKTAAFLCSVGVVIALLVFVPADFEIRAEGRLMPRRYRELFAPSDGVIHQLHVRHGESVTAGTPLLELHRRELEYEEARLLGEVLTNQKRLDAIRSAILNHKPALASSSSEIHELTSEEARLRILLASLRDQQTILERERAELAIASPIDGQVLTWGIEDVLTLRPVLRGERLLSVADPTGPWRLDLRIADHDIEYLKAARIEMHALDVRFILASHAGESYQGTVEQIAMATELDEFDQLTVLVRAAFDAEQLSELRPGARVIANVHCGRRSIGYVWFRELYDVVKTRLLF